MRFIYGIGGESTEREARRQRKSGLKPARSDTIAICELHPCPRHRGQFSFANASILRKAFGVSLRFAVSSADVVVKTIHQIVCLT